jgi:hypothetical protein
MRKFRRARSVDVTSSTETVIQAKPIASGAGKPEPEKPVGYSGIPNLDSKPYRPGRNIMDPPGVMWTCIPLFFGICVAVKWTEVKLENSESKAGWIMTGIHLGSMRTESLSLNDW